MRVPVNRPVRCKCPNCGTKFLFDYGIEIAESTEVTQTPENVFIQTFRAKETANFTSNAEATEPNLKTTAQSKKVKSNNIKWFPVFGCLIIGGFVLWAFSKIDSSATHYNGDLYSENTYQVKDSASEFEMPHLHLHPPHQNEHSTMNDHSFKDPFVRSDPPKSPNDYNWSEADIKQRDERMAAMEKQLMVFLESVNNGLINPADRSTWGNLNDRGFFTDNWIKAFNNLSPEDKRLLLKNCSEYMKSQPQYYQNVSELGMGLRSTSSICRPTPKVSFWKSLWGAIKRVKIRIPI